MSKTRLVGGLQALKAKHSPRGREPCEPGCSRPKGSEPCLNRPSYGAWRRWHLTDVAESLNAHVSILLQIERVLKRFCVGCIDGPDRVSLQVEECPGARHPNWNPAKSLH